MSKREKPETVADETLEAARGGGVFQTPAGGWGKDGQVMGKGPLPISLDDVEGEPVTRHMDISTKNHG